MYYPEFSKFEQLSETMERVAVMLEYECGDETPLSIYLKLCKEEYCYLLESMESSDKKGRYSFIGRRPFATFKSYGRSIEISECGKVNRMEGRPIERLREMLDKYRCNYIEGIPDFSGGAVGHLAYDIVRDFEKLPLKNPDDMNLPEMHLMFTDEVIAFDHLKKTIGIIVYQKIDGNPAKSYGKALERLVEIRDEIKNAEIEYKSEERPGKRELAYTSNISEKQFTENVLKAKQYIKDGDIFQVVLSQRFCIETEMNPFQAYMNLREINPSPYMFYIDFGDYRLAGASPEMLVKTVDRYVETCPIAGTRPRGKSEAEDNKLIAELMADEKELAEHRMLVDLARNDIGKITEFGSVEISKTMHVQKYSHVMHIVSNVTGILKKGLTAIDAFISCFPAGTVSGAPKIRAMEIIEELENIKRGIYAGAVGYFGFNGDMDTCIAIRTIVFKGNRAYIQAGAGIVADSNPANEYKETISKATALMKAIE